jgi:acetyltransferase
VAVIGASSEPHTVGATVMANVSAGGFTGKVYAVNPRHRQIKGVRAYRDVAALPEAPDLAVICTPPPTIPAIVGELGARGTKAAIVISAGLGAANDAQGRSLTQAMLDAARPHTLRILGPNCVGILKPGIGLNASFAHAGATPGRIAFISQSGALVTALLDWANSRSVGFSHFISIGEAADVDVADLLDYLGSEPDTRAILLYVESIRGARKFMSAARAAARNKPIVVVKAGRGAEGAKAAASHSGALAGSDAVFDAAIRRAGMLRVDTMLDMFSAVETLSHADRERYRGERVAIMTNGGGAAVMAADAMALGGGRLSELSADTIARLDRILPATWSRANPVDIIGDAPVERYVETLKALCEDPEVDAVLFLHAPTAIVPSEAIAQACAPVAAAARCPVLSCWLGDSAVARARSVFHQAGIADYGTPEQTVRAFLNRVQFRRNQASLIEAPPASPTHFTPDRGRVHEIVAAALDAGRELLHEAEAKAVLAAYGIPVVETRIASSVEEAAGAAAAIGFPVALKILSPDITHKSDVGGVALDLESAAQVRSAADAMLARVGARRPDARVSGFTVQRMVRRPGAHELIAGASVDPLFGPVILFGQGGTAVEVIADRAVALPPLNLKLARELVSHTRVARLLAGYRDRPPADHDAIHAALVQLSQLLIDVAEIAELDINPLLADERGVLALDARIRVARATAGAHDRLAIRPYPDELEERVALRGETVVLRPIRPEDTPQHQRFLERLDIEDIRMRFFYTKRNFAPSELARLTQIDYEREMAFIATRPEEPSGEETLGVIRTITDPENERAEFAIIVRSDMKGGGIGRLLLEKMIGYCARRGTRTMVGDVLRENARMLNLVRELGFTVERSPDPDVVSVTLPLQPGAST